MRREFQFAAGTNITSITLTNNPDGTQTVTVNAAGAGVITLAGDASGPSNANQVDRVTVPTNANPGLAGGAGAALPATPAGYMNLGINGDLTTWVPFYRPGA